MKYLELVSRAEQQPDRTAIIDQAGPHTYRELLAASQRVAATLLNGDRDLAEAPVAFMVSPSFDYVAVQWGIWRAGGIAVPLNITHPTPELEYVLDDTGATVAMALDEHHKRLTELAAPRGLRLLGPEVFTGGESSLPAVDPGRRAMILYTSGTTGRPKGVVTTHRNLVAQIESLAEAWEWVPDDRILLTLPLHHVHGIVNVLGCCLWVGACCEIHTRFEAGPTWERLASGELTLYMAVPTIYHRLIEAWEGWPPGEQERLSAGCRQLRLMVSGSAALPVPMLERWRHISGQVLLERYGMTEIGMALSNPLHGERQPGRVGSPLPGVEVRLTDEAGEELGDDQVGEIEVRSPTVFLEYWQRPEATAAAFSDGRWFRTGDVAVRQQGVYRILGRQSVDIIKTGGEKVSALEIEEVLLGHRDVSECAVVGLEDPEWGQRVVAAVVSEESMDPEGLREWCRRHLAPAKVPKEFVAVDSLPRNAMGKVNKPALVEQLAVTG